MALDTLYGDHAAEHYRGPVIDYEADGWEPPEGAYRPPVESEPTANQVPGAANTRPLTVLYRLGHHSVYRAVDGGTDLAG